MMGHCNNQISFSSASSGQDVGVGSVATNPLNIMSVTDASYQLGRVVDHDNVVVIFFQVAGNAKADIAGTADDDFHEANLVIIYSGYVSINGSDLANAVRICYLIM